MMHAAVVILNWNGVDFLRRFLGGVLESVRGLAEVVVADNGSTDDSLAVVRSEFVGVHVVEFAQNWGFAEGYNRALAWVRENLQSEVYVLLNSDVEVKGRWLEPLLARLANDEKIWAVMPKIRSQLSPDFFEYAGAAGGFLDFLGYPYCRGRFLSHVERDEGQYDTACEIHWATGACLAVRADAYWRVGGLEGRFFAHMEEIDFCWRLRRMGGKVWVEPQSVVYHVGGGALPNDSPRKLYLNFRNSLWTLRRNLSPRRRLVLMPLRSLFDFAAMMLYLLRGERANAQAVIRAYRDAMRGKKGMCYIRVPNDRYVPLARRSVAWDFYVRGKCN